jgi:protease-4
MRSVLPASILLFAFNASADPLPPRAERLFSPGRAVASEDSPEALVLNPANIAFMQGAEGRWLGARCPDTQKVACGHALSAATPILFGLAGGFRIDYVTPPPLLTIGPIGIADYAWLTWGLAYKVSDAIALGGTFQYSASQNNVTNGIAGFSFGATLRPNPYLSLSAVAHDVNRGTSAPLPNNVPNTPQGFALLDRSWVLGFALRPTGRRGFEIGGELRYLEGAVDTSGSRNDQWIPRFTAGLDIPNVGRIRGDVEIAHLPNDSRRGVVGTVGIELGWRNYRAGGGAIFGNGLGGANPNGAVGEYLTASISSFDVAPALPKPTRAISIRIESTPSTKGHVALLRRLWKMSEDPNVAAVTLILRTEPAASFAHAEELADALRVLRARGKKSICSLEDNGAASLYVCANADRTVVNPAGGIRYAGLKSTYYYLAGLLQKIGVRAEFVRIGAHKSAPEQFTNEGATDVSRADHEDMLREREAVFVRNMAVGRKMSEQRVRDETAKGPFIAQEAKDAGFIDAFAFDDELERVTREVVGKDVSMEKWSEDDRQPEQFGPREKIAILYLDGDMVDGRSQKIPILDMKLMGSYTIAESIKQIRDDKTIKGVVVRVESPGGSSMAADVMWRELKLLAEKKPTVISMGSVAASGGYYVATAAKRIYALPLTVTGSIGIFYGKADLSGLLGKIGVSVETYRTTPRADAESLFRPFTDDEKRELTRKVSQFYDVFLDRCAEGRHMTKQEVDAVGQGRVWTGQQALDRHLVDKLGGMREALYDIRQQTNLPSDAPIVEYPIANPTLFERALELAGVAKAQTINIAGIPVPIKDLLRAVAPVALYKADVPLARMEWSPLEDEQGSSEP